MLSQDPANERSLLQVSRWTDRMKARRTHKEAEHRLRETHLLSHCSHAGERVMVAFPNTYSVGMANLGFQTVYADLLERQDVHVERVFLTDDPRSVESATRLSNARLILFSISFELDVLGVVEMLFRSGIPLRSSERGLKDPLIVAGGMVPTANPLALSDVVDVFLRGESEAVLMPFVDQWLNKEHLNKQSLLESLASLPGAYVPQIHGNHSWCCLPAVAERVDLNDAVPAHSAILTPEGEFRDAFLIEISRGCRNHCRFCGIRQIQGQPRFHSKEKVTALLDRHGQAVSRVGLVAADLGSNPDTMAICEAIVSSGRQLTTSSVEVSAANSDLLDLLRRGGQKTLTIAPETGSEKVRRQLGKLLTDADILNTASRAIEAGIPSLKLYFLAGVGDLLQDESGVSGESAAIVSLVREIAQRRQEKGSMVVGLSPLVPRYGTPLQSKPLPDRRHVQQVISAVRHGLRDFSGISVRAGGWFEAATEWILSHATAEMSETLMRAGVDTQNRRAILAEEIAKR